MCNSPFLIAQKMKTYNIVLDFGASPDNKTDNYAAFTKAAAVISQAGSGILVIPKGNYYIAAYKIIGGDKKNNVTDIIFRNCKGLIIQGNNSMVRVNGNFRRNRDYKLDGLPFNYAYNNTVCPFKFVNCKDVQIKNIELYGEADKMKKQERVVEGENYGIFFSDDEPGDTSSRIVMENITAHHFATDGMGIRSSGENIIINKCYSYKNARQGLSIVKGRNIKILHSEFDSTGVTGAYGRHQPAAGIDIENEFGKGKLSNVFIQNCSMKGNTGFQIVTTLPSENIIIDSCFISDSTSGYSEGMNGVGMYSLNSTLSNSIIFATIQVDIADQIYRGKIVQEYRKNIIYSGHRGIVSADFSRPVNVIGNLFIMLPHPQLNTYFPYFQNNNGRFNENIIVVHADIIKKTPNQVTALAQGAIEAINNFWLVNGYDIPKSQRRKNYFYMALTETKNFKNQFTPENDKMDALDFPQRKKLTDAQVDKILSNPVFSAYKQTFFNKTLLIQADIVRKYTDSIVAKVKD